MNEKTTKIADYDEIWATLDRVSKRLDRVTEHQEETARQIKETGEQMKKTDERLDKLCKQVDGIDDNIGHHAEQFFQDVLKETLTFGGEKYDEMYPNAGYKLGNDGVEFDILLVNGKNVALIEVKNRIHPNFVEKLAVEKTAKFRKFFPLYKNHQVYLGIAGFSFSKSVQEKAKKYGVGIIRQIGKTIEIEADHLKAY
jgi:hypothetical protein